MMIPEVIEWLKNRPEINTIILCGIETHVCINATVIDLLAQDYSVHILVDATSSRTKLDRSVALDRKAFINRVNDGSKLSKLVKKRSMLVFNWSKLV